MNSELPVGTEALLAERKRLEGMLAASEDWRALLELKGRQDRGEGLSAVNAARLETLLIDALAENPHYMRHKAVCAALDGAAQGRSQPAKVSRDVDTNPAVDDMTRIRGIDTNTARRLRELGVFTYGQIAEWTSIDIHRISNELGIGKLIHSQNWIEQGALLALANPRSVPPSMPAKTPAAPSSSKAPPQKSEMPVVLPKQGPLPVPSFTAKPTLNESLAPSAAARPVMQEPPRQAPQQSISPAPAAAKPADAPAPPPQKPATVVYYVSPGDKGDKPAPLSPQPLRDATVPIDVSAKPRIEIPQRSAAPAANSTPASISPPKPQVVTQPSLPASQTESAKAPAPSSSPQNTKAVPISARPAQSTAATPASTQSAAAVPAMTITEAIAYAAAAARSSHKPSADAPQIARAEVKPPSGPPNPAMRETAHVPSAPPPLPSGFTATEPTPPPKAVVRPRMQRSDPPPRAISIDRDREELAMFNGHVEEASVEIIRKPAPCKTPTLQAALAAAAPQIAQDVARQETPRAATPIGRFLKALTGN